MKVHINLQVYCSPKYRNRFSIYLHQYRSEGSSHRS